MTRQMADGGGTCLMVVVLVWAGLGCDERSGQPPSEPAVAPPTAALPSRGEGGAASGATSRRRPLAPAAAPPVAQSAVDPLVAFPPGLSSGALALCGQLDGDLRFPGAVANRVARFLRYDADCKTVVSRYRTLIDEVTPKLVARRSSVKHARSKLDGLAGADRPAFWRWLDSVRVLLEDELSPQSHELEQAAKVFRRRCPKQARAVARLSRVVDKIHIRTRIDLHHFFANQGAGKQEHKAPRGPTPPPPAMPLVPLPRGLTAESRLHCQQFSAGLQAFLGAIRSTRDLFGSLSDCSAVIRGLDKLDQQQPRWRALEREFGRSYVALTLVTASDQAPAKRWHRKLGRRMERQLKRVARSMMKNVFRFRRRCPEQFRLMGQRGHRLGPRTVGMGSSIELILTRPVGRGPWSYEWRWETE